MGVVYLFMQNTLWKNKFLELRMDVFELWLRYSKTLLLVVEYQFGHRTGHRDFDGFLLGWFGRSTSGRSTNDTSDPGTLKTYNLYMVTIPPELGDTTQEKPFLRQKSNWVMLIGTSKLCSRALSYRRGSVGFNVDYQNNGTWNKQYTTAIGCIRR